MNISKCKCGGNAIIRQDNFGVYYDDWKIFCEKCGMQTGWTKNKEDAIEIWNRTMDASDINVGHKFDKDINVSSKERTAKVEQIAEVYHEDIVSHFLCGMCGVCGETTYDHARFCINCGARLEWE